MARLTDAIGNEVMGKTVTLYFTPAPAPTPSGTITFFPTTEGKVVHVGDEAIVLEHEYGRTVVYSWDHVIGIGVTGYQAPHAQAYTAAPRYKSSRE